MKRVGGLMELHGRPALVALLLGLFISVLVPGALAQGSGGSGGGGVTVTTTTLAMSNVAPLLNGAVPAGQVTFTYSKDGSSKNLLIEVSNVNVPDGDTLDVEVDQAWKIGKWVQHSYLWLPVTIHNGSGSLSWSTAQGDVVPFLLPTAGTTTISIWGDYTVWPGTDVPETGVQALWEVFGALTRG
jgi:hypothetical protein